jgi:hypothetical protein
MAYMKVYEKYHNKNADITLANSFPALAFRKSDEKRKRKKLNSKK